MLSQVKQNFHLESEKSLNDQINIGLNASYVYQSMYSYYERDDVALYGFSKLFRKHYNEEREHVDKHITYLNNRGGRVVFSDIKRPDNLEWGTGAQGLKSSLTLHKQMNASLLCLHAVGSTHNDPHLCDYLEKEYLPYRVEMIKIFADYQTQLNRAGPGGLGEYLFDKELLEKL